MRKFRQIIFLKDVLLLSLNAFGGPQAHIAQFLKVLVHKHGYIKEEELLDLNAFCQVLPGPSSTQTLTAIGFRIGGPKLAFLSLLVWILPACAAMTLAAIFIAQFSDKSFTRLVPPIAVGFVAYAAYRIGSLVVNSRTSYGIFILSAVVSFYVQNHAIFPIIMLLGGVATSWKINQQEKQVKKDPLKVEWSNLILYLGIFLAAILVSQLTHALPVRLFENFFRNGSLTFGGGDALGAIFHKEFVVTKEYLTEKDFLTGLAINKTLPGPVFSFSSFVGSITLGKEYGLLGFIGGGIIGAVGIFLPGVILIFFVIRFWDRLKQYRVVKASLEGINAASAGIVFATALILFEPLKKVEIQEQIVNYFALGITVMLQIFTRIAPVWIIAAGALIGLVFYS